MLVQNPIEPERARQAHDGADEAASRWSYETDGIKASVYSIADRGLFLEISLDARRLSAVWPTSRISLHADQEQLVDFVMRSCLAARQWRDAADTRDSQWLANVVKRLAIHGVGNIGSPPSAVRDLH